MPESGKLYQLTHIFSKHGYDPKAGKAITTVPIQVTGSKNRVVYKRDTCDDRISRGEWGRFKYKVSDEEGESEEGTVVLVSPEHVVAQSDFLFSDEDWTTVGNRHKNGVFFEPSSRGLMNYYIYALDQSINVNSDGNGEDLDIWYFDLPSKFLGWQGIMYRGTLEFVISSFGGDFSEEFQNGGGKLNLVEITCNKCNVNTGVKIGLPLENAGGFDGNTKKFSLTLTETSGWMMDPKNTLLPWTPISKCRFIEVLSSISSIQILGDFTSWYESISIDDVRLVAAKPKERNHLPVCAQKTSDARRCDCGKYRV